MTGQVIRFRFAWRWQVLALSRPARCARVARSLFDPERVGPESGAIAAVALPLLLKRAGDAATVKRIGDSAALRRMWKRHERPCKTA